MNPCSMGAGFPLLTTVTPLCPSEPSLAEARHVNPHPGPFRRVDAGWKFESRHPWRQAGAEMIAPSLLF